MKKIVLTTLLFMFLVIPLYHCFQQHAPADEGMISFSMTNDKLFAASNGGLIEELIDFNEITQQATIASFYSKVYHLSEEIGPRPSGSAANEEARDWVFQQLQNCIDSKDDVFLYGNHYNVIGIKYGQHEATDYTICFTGHFDTVPLSPGADDNGSGTALFLEIARLLAPYSNLAVTTAFLGCNAEEIGLIGSFEMAPYIKDLLDPDLVINADQILNDEPFLSYTDDDLPYDSYRYIADLIDMFRYNYYGNYLYLMELSPKTEGWHRSDHYPFYLEGIPVLVMSEITKTPYYHSPDDKANQPEYDYSYGTELAGSIASTVLFLSSRRIDNFTQMDFKGELGPGDNCTYHVQVLDSDLFSSVLTSNYGSVDFEISGITSWTSETGFLNLSTGRYDIVIRNTGDDTASFCSSNYFSQDRNSNGITDYFEADHDGDGISTHDEQVIHGTDPYKIDTDNDTLDDYYEISMLLDPASNDSDGDLIDDGYEFSHGLNPWINDASLDHDSDGLTSYQEYLLGTHPHMKDTDRDGYPDGDEISKGSDPLDATSVPAETSSETTSGTSHSTGTSGQEPDSTPFPSLITLPLCFGLIYCFKKKNSR